MKRILIVVIALTFMLSTACSIFGRQEGEPDRTGSYSQINQEIKRGADWKQIVKHSDFQLGAKKYDKDYDEYRTDIGTYPMIDGSTACVPLAYEFAWQHLKLSNEDARGFVNFNTTHDAYVNLISKVGIDAGTIDSKNISINESLVDIIFVTEPSNAELALAKKEKVALTIRPICYDSFVFITHKDNPVNNLTVEQVQKIYAGEITNWKDVGGSDESIFAYQREANSGSQTTMEKQVMKGKKMIPANKVNVKEFMSDLVEVVGEYQNKNASIGYTFKYYIDTLYKDSNIKVLNINGIEPSTANMRNKTYPFTTNYFGVIRTEDKDKVGGKFLDWVLSDEGQKCVAQAGYCTLKYVG